MAQQFNESSPNLNGRTVVALLEAEPSELTALLHARAAVPIAIPAISEALYEELEEVRRLIDELAAGKYEVVLFMSGGAVSSLFECARELGRQGDLASALRLVNVACRGPKASAALRRYGLYAKPESGVPFTTGALTRALQQLELTGKGVLRFNGEPNDSLALSLSAQSAKLREISLVQRRAPIATAAAESLLRLIIGGGVHALVVSCEIQFLHLYQVARRQELAREFVYALRKRVVVAAVGTSCRDVLEAHGVRPQPMPAHPQMLTMALLHFLGTRGAAGSSALPV